MSLMMKRKKLRKSLLLKLQNKKKVNWTKEFKN